MAKGVFLHRPGSIYDDLPHKRYQFPKQYKTRVEQTVGDWIVYNELADGKGSSGYSAIAKVSRVEPDPLIPNMFVAHMEQGSYLGFEKFVPYRSGSDFMETRLTTGTNKPSGYVQSAVREISDEDFFRICHRGNPLEDELPRTDDIDEADPGYTSDGFRESAVPFEFGGERERFLQLQSRPIRKKIFRNAVIKAYDKTCAFTGMQFINGGGRAEVQAAHIVPVEQNGPDHVQNGMALSGTVHWMFDRGLLSLSNDYEILISRQVNDIDRVRNLMLPDGKARVPDDHRMRPHPTFLDWHRSNCFKQ
jgi:putative restriction endonuclease